MLELAQIELDYGKSLSVKDAPSDRCARQDPGHRNIATGGVNSLAAA